MQEESKAVQEVAKATGKALDVVQNAGTFIARFVAGPLEQAAGIYEDHLKYLRWERQVRLMTRAEEFLRQAGLQAPTRAVPLKIAIPLLQAAIVEEDDMLQDRWAQLLVNAANASSGIAVQRSFLSILEELTPLEAKILDALYASPFALDQFASMSTDELPHATRIFGTDEESDAQPSEEVAIALGNLARLGCIIRPSIWDGGESFVSVHRTALGAAFVRACQAG